jgi:integrase/recombinase XerD
MKQLQLNNASFRYLEESYKEWLDIMGYAPSSVYYMPLHVRELLHYLEGIGVSNIKELEHKHVQQHYSKLKERSNRRREGGLSNNHLNKHLQALKKFTEYLRQVGRVDVTLNLHNEASDAGSIEVLNREEVELLFKATYKRPDRIARSFNDEQQEALQSRDRAMLSVYYGCGLRRNEGVCLDVSDINFEGSLLHVRKGKNYKERFVPISKTSLKYLQGYVYNHRPLLLTSSRSEALFISQRGARVNSQTLLLRLKYLKQRSEDKVLIDKEVGLHTLRHSIATHLLQAGMKLEYIARFLGHKSLESTQIYTHLAGMDDEQEFNGIPRFERAHLHEDERSK